MIILFQSVWKFLNGQLVSNVLGGLLVALLVWFFLEKRIRSILDYKAKLNLFISLRGDLSFDLWLAEELIKNTDKYSKGNKITYANYKTKALEDFLYQRPLVIDNGFYEKLQVLTHRLLEVDNRFLDQIRGGNTQNKQLVLKNAKTVKKMLVLFIMRVDIERLKFENKRNYFNGVKDLFNKLKSKLLSNK